MRGSRLRKTVPVGLLTKCLILVNLGGREMVTLALSLSELPVVHSINSDTSQLTSKLRALIGS
jgi:hypothetical protein